MLVLSMVISQVVVDNYMVMYDVLLKDARINRADGGVAVLEVGTSSSKNAFLLMRSQFVVGTTNE
jgi:hypothetical protein